jgi:two-component system chemotaxis response regulator CheB
MPAAIFVVIHTTAEAPGVLPQLLNRSGKLPAITAVHGAEILPGRIHVAPPDRHLILEKGRIRLLRGPTENRHRPAIDPLFRSAANSYGARVVGVVLTGYLDDGTAGLVSIKRNGGVAVVQDPDDAVVPGMPRSAVENADPDYILPLAEIGPLLVSLVEEREQVKLEEVPPMRDEKDQSHETPSVFACPDCHGTLWEVQEGELLRFRCRVGHSFSAESMIEVHDESTERALWAALRSLEENAEVSTRMAKRALQRNHPLTAQRYSERAQAACANAEVLREILGNGRGMGSPSATYKNRTEERTGT